MPATDSPARRSYKTTDANKHSKMTPHVTLIQICDIQPQPNLRRFKSRSRYIQTLVSVMATMLSFTVAIDGRAAIVSVSGDVEVIAPPANVSAGVLTSLTTAYVFQERSNFSLTEDVKVNVSEPGTSPLDTGKNFSPIDILSGTPVDSYFIHMNPAITGVVVIEGSITFDREILGLAVGDGTLFPSDLILGHPGTVYPPGPAPYRGLEFGFGDGAASGTIDRITLSEDRHTVDFTARVGGLDQFRVITAVPEASSIAMCGLASFGLLALRYRRRFTRQS